jgi:ABC-type iron transport system FetAB permease component
VESLIDAESYGWIYLAFIGLVFCILAFWMWKRGWLHLSFFLLPVAMLLVQSEIFSGMPKENVVIVGILIVGGMFVAGGTLSWVLKEDRNRLLALGITVVLANGITSFINSFYRTIEGSFWANFSLIGGATTVFGLSLVAAPKLLALFSNAVTKRRDRKQHG